MNKDLIIDQSVVSYFKQLRKKHKFSQLDMAKELGVSQSYFNKIERGEQPLKLWMLEPVARKLGVNVLDAINHSVKSKVNQEDLDHLFSAVREKELQNTIEALKEQLKLVQESNKMYEVQMRQLSEIQHTSARILKQVMSHNDLLRNYLLPFYDEIKDLEFEDLKKVNPKMTLEGYHDFHQKRKEIADVLNLSFEDYKNSFSLFSEIYNGGKEE